MADFVICKNKTCRWASASCLTAKKGRYKKVMLINKIALALAIIGCINWGLVGLFSFDAVAWLFGGTGAILSRIVYTLVAIAGLWCVNLLFRDDEEMASHHA